MKKRHKEVEPESSDRWLLTYADLITLLLGLFVILYAMSKIDAGKYAAVVEALGGAFGSAKSPGVMQGQIGVLENPFPELRKEHETIAKQIRDNLPMSALSGPITVTQNERGVTVHIMDKMLFPSGSADLMMGAYEILDSLAGVLNRLPNDIRVEGHTDNVPISTPQFPSNWHLSVARAVNTGYYLIHEHGLTPERLNVVGYAEYRPLVPNTSDDNRSRNRRVDIVIITAPAPKTPESATDKQPPTGTQP